MMGDNLCGNGFLWLWRLPVVRGILWRGDLAKRRTAPFGCAAAVNPVIAVYLKHRDHRFQGRFATQRG